ncbi:MAG: MotA/TolQ/ExbB proton channel family protein [Gammaproteobacteria bacterium]|nr:MotA/TolQ/ExbB proton channel family protein [Gammaproteobacteria bacterium]MDE2023046.1 MotA/TolQ/ExbB proton channel family protein [Gammaproteobacteria bacterium]MDE2140275.1 MotA/TolQ/ExbB proton channel family protein [Gammaproteobacteria bacterium]MDE2273785.1 MotA/TolQ/ExbB proton channel family protein [Gammaproteobacteria bacterium]
MIEIIKSGGWLMLPLILCSILVVAIVAERLWTLQARRVAPEHLAAQVWNWLKNGELDDERLQALRAGSPLGRILAAGLEQRHASRSAMNEAIEDTGRHVVHELDRYLITLGTIASISPLLGLLGTVLGIMHVFAAISISGLGNPAMLAAGISQALITTVAGLAVAIPAYVLFRYLRGKVDDLVVRMERETTRLMHAVRSAHNEPQVLPALKAVSAGEGRA